MSVMGTEKKAGEDCSGGTPLRRVNVGRQVWFGMNHVFPHPDTAAHDHTCLELAFIVRGRVRHLTVHGGRQCGAGSIFIIPPGVWHGYAQCRRLEIYNCLLSPGMLQSELGWTAHDPELSRLLPTPLSRHTEIVPLELPPAARLRIEAALKALHETYQKTRSRPAILGRFLLLLEEVRISARRVEAKAVPERAEHPSVRQGLEELHRDLTRHWTLTELATALHINPSYLVRLFQAQTGQAPMKYLAQRRAEQAATLLLSSPLSIGEIGARVGWPEPKQFARNFRHFHGVNARVYRQKMLNWFADSGEPIQAEF